MQRSPATEAAGREKREEMSEQGDNFGMCRTDDQKAAYTKGWEDAKAGKGDDFAGSGMGLVFREFYEFGQLDASG